MLLLAFSTYKCGVLHIQVWSVKSLVWYKDPYDNVCCKIIGLYFIKNHYKNNHLTHFFQYKKSKMFISPIFSLLPINNVHLAHLFTTTNQKCSFNKSSVILLSIPVIYIKYIVHILYLHRASKAFL